MPDKLYVVLSGKRKSGKDFLADKIVSHFSQPYATIVRLSSPIKLEYAKEHNLDYERLLESSHYKELYRKAMVTWSESVRNKDPSIFCRLALSHIDPKCQLIIVSDARRYSDLVFFLEQYSSLKCVFIRVTASESSRVDRGWTFVDGIDNAETECGLDSWNNWDLVVDNSASDVDLVTEILNKIYSTISQKNITFSVS